MTPHRIRIMITPAGFVCRVCDRPVRWVRSDEPTPWRWAHVDPDELAASMRRHPAGGRLP